MDPSTMERLMAEARAEAERSWSEGGIPVGAVLATEDGTVDRKSTRLNSSHRT